MKKLVYRFKDVIFGFFLLSCALVFFPDEFVISILLFALITRGGIIMIRSATAWDIKTK